MRALACIAVLALAVAAPASAKLTPPEQAWAAPLINVWNLQNAGLHLVLQQASAKNALIAGEKPQNLALTKTLAVLADCKAPADLIKKAGAPPTARLAAFRSSLNAACIHDSNGANDLAKAIGAIAKNQPARAKTFLSAGVAQFRIGTAQLSKAYGALTAIGGSGGLKA